ncbi:MAG: hypothetical protein KatS3mg081_1473 [Gemmatimonadales bacterium]|nr:MAG: hypothetical protein KatS3mg081_1473 [Gemmatimonadales bacterium]
MYSTALTLIETLSRVITSWGGMSIATIRNETRCSLAKKRGTKTSPGPLVAQYLPRKNVTARSYCLMTCSEPYI